MLQTHLVDFHKAGPHSDVCIVQLRDLAEDSVHDIWDYPTLGAIGVEGTPHGVSFAASGLPISEHRGIVPCGYCRTASVPVQVGALEQQARASSTEQLRTFKEAGHQGCHAVLVQPLGGGPVAAENVVVREAVLPVVALRRHLRPGRPARHQPRHHPARAGAGADLGLAERDVQALLEPLHDLVVDEGPDVHRHAHGAGGLLAGRRPRPAGPGPGRGRGRGRGRLLNGPPLRHGCPAGLRARRGHGPGPRVVTWEGERGGGGRRRMGEKRGGGGGGPGPGPGWGTESGCAPGV